MTSDEIRNRIDIIQPVGFKKAAWEIAYQLAVMNERNASGDQQAVDEMLKKARKMKC